MSISRYDRPLSTVSHATETFPERSVDVCDHLNDYLTTNPLFYRLVEGKDIVWDEAYNTARLRPEIAAYFDVAVTRLHEYVHTNMRRTTGQECWTNYPALYLPVIDRAGISHRSFQRFFDYDALGQVRTWLGQSGSVAHVSSMAKMFQNWGLELLAVAERLRDMDVRTGANRFAERSKEAMDHARGCTCAIRLKHASLVERPCPYTKSGCDITRLFFRRALDESEARAANTIGDLNVQIRALTHELGIAKAHVSRLRGLVVQETPDDTPLADHSKRLPYYSLYDDVFGDNVSDTSDIDGVAMSDHGSPSPEAFEEYLHESYEESVTAATSGSDDELYKIVI